MTVLRGFRWPRLWLGLWLLMIAAVVMGSLLPSTALPKPMFFGVDKVQHLLGYFALAAYAVMLFADGPAQRRAAGGLVLLGIAIEGAQSALTASRVADAGDVLANLVGVLLGMGLRWTRGADMLRRIDTRLSGSV